jgi:hypothetical protein
METIKKMNLSAIEDRLSIYEMQEIQAGSGFCAAFSAVAVGYEVGVALNWWNPLGWAGQVTVIAGGLYCIAAR